MSHRAISSTYRDSSATVERVVSADRNYKIDDDVRVWLDPGGGITIKAVTVDGDPVELSTSQAQSLADAFLDLINADNE